VRQDLPEVERFWTEHPLFVFESPHKAGSPEFFRSHDEVRWEEEGRFAEHLYEFERHAGERVLDVGCGVGWLVSRFARGGAVVTGVDLTDSAVRLTRQRLELEGLHAEVRQANAEQLPFADASFDFVTSAGVLHHTPETRRAVAEIHRVLRPGGRAMISLYYRNFLLNRFFWPATRLVIRHFIGAIPGRAKFREVSTVEDLARLYDGDDNPIGKIYTRAQVRRLLSQFTLEGIEIHYFPARFVPLRLPRFLRRVTDRCFGLMIYARLRKDPAR
jgi:SAM-dependent methyltransferase